MLATTAMASLIECVFHVGLVTVTLLFFPQCLHHAMAMTLRIFNGSNDMGHRHSLIRLAKD